MTFASPTSQSQLPTNSRCNMASQTETTTTTSVATDLPRLTHYEPPRLNLHLLRANCQVRKEASAILLGTTSSPWTMRPASPPLWRGSRWRAKPCSPSSTSPHLAHHCRRPLRRCRSEPLEQTHVGYADRPAERLAHAVHLHGTKILQTEGPGEDEEDGPGVGRRSISVWGSRGPAHPASKRVTVSLDG